ncbi:MAG: hypothetical protein KGR98_03630 [Verrucomicrobia bacterium]|nr:hypothetical protein [Verrucomicrobiota bacterium]MDE3098874.1 hypothetical protein [Verrucomicrobiota bacterium]
MIATQSDCLFFKLANGESVPCSVDMISVEITNPSVSQVDPETLRHATASVFHYFKNELERQAVTVGEFAGALEKALRQLGYAIHAGVVESHWGGVLETDLVTLARSGGNSLELFFFPRLRCELREQLRQSPRVVRFSGLRGCAKQLAGARRWSGRCEKIREQIIEYLRGCLTAEPESNRCSLVVK